MTIQQLEAFSNTKPELRYITEEIIKYLGANPGGDAPGGSSYLVAEVTLTDDDIKDLPSTQVELIAGVGANKRIFIIGGVLIFNTVGAYTNISNIDNVDGITLGFFGGAEMGKIPSPFLASILSNAGQNSAIRLVPDFAVFSPTDMDVVAEGADSYATKSSTGLGTSLTFFIDNYSADYNTDLGNFTGGNTDNTIKIKIYYIVEDL